MLSSALGQLGTAVVLIARSSGEVLLSQGSFLEPHCGKWPGRDWRDALDIPPEQLAVISEAIDAGLAAVLPPTILCASQDREVLVSGLLAPQQWQGRETVLLLLREAGSRDTDLFLQALEEGDSAVVLGVDALEYSPNRGVAFVDGLMMDLRAAAQQVLRDGDRVGLPSGACLPIILPGVEPTEALDICRALLSHLHSLPGAQGSAWGRASIGVARRGELQGALATFVAANNALGQAQRQATDERIHFSSPWDQFGQVAAAIHSSGLFADSACLDARAGFLRELVALPGTGTTAYLWQVVELVLRQPGVAASGLYRRNYAGRFEFVAGGVNGEGVPQEITARQMPRSLKNAERALNTISGPSDPALQLLYFGTEDAPLGCLAIYAMATEQASFCPGNAELHFLASVLEAMPGWGEQAGGPAREPVPGEPMETGIEGYVIDNMEGATDQAAFLAQVDMPVAVIGPRGTGKMYIAQLILQHSGGSPDDMVRIDCREFRNRSEAMRVIAAALEQGEGKTLVFKSPHLMHPEAQLKLARQLGSRTLADGGSPRYLPVAKYVALFPDSLEHLMAHGGLEHRLASVFAGHPIRVPPIRDRKRAVMRWAHKILEQESGRLDRRVQGFTPDAAQALLQHDWPGNISEMRDVIREALGKTDKDWLTPVDLGLYSGLRADGGARSSSERPFLRVSQQEGEEPEHYQPSTQEALRVALGVALDTLLQTDTVKPLGTWLDDEVILAACERYRGDSGGAARFLHTRSRNISRWLPKILSRDHERSGSLLWQEPRKLVQQWIRETAQLTQSPQQLAQDMLMSHVLQQCDGISVADRARIMGVSTPTYQKRLKQLLQDA